MNSCYWCRHASFEFTKIKSNFHSNSYKIKMNLCEKHYEEYVHDLIRHSNTTIKSKEIWHGQIRECSNCSLVVGVLLHENNKKFCSFCHKKYKDRNCCEENCECLEFCPVCQKSRGPVK